MFRIIDTIQFSGALLDRYPELKARGAGILAILDPKDTASGFKEDAREATLILPSGDRKNLAIDAVEKNKGGVIGLFFRAAGEADIPRGASVSVS